MLIGGLGFLENPIERSRIPQKFYYINLSIYFSTSYVHNSALIDADTNWWNRNLVEEVFLAEEAEKICGMAISPLKQADKLVCIWVGNKNGEFSIKSAYHT